ncbi:MAG TPA: thioredoxin domain-containing protein [Caulobacteraceae bacterium]
MIIVDKRAMVGGLLAFGLAACGKAPVAAPLPDDMSMGNAKAPVTVIEYASVGCPICGAWYREVFPSFKAKYIDTGRVRFVSREMLVGNSSEVALAAAGFLLARCAGRDRYFTVTDAIYKGQTAAYADPHGFLLNLARSMGFDDARFDACVTDRAALNALNARVDAYANTDKVNATPTFVINGKALEPGYHPLSDLDAAIAAAQSSR